MSTTVKEVLAIAREEIGTKESPAGSNKVKYSDWYGVKEIYGSYQPWCLVFICWLFDKADMPFPKIQHAKGFAYCPIAVGWFKQNRKFFNRNPLPGDVVFFDWGKDGKADHVGIIEEVYPTYVKTIEGNTSIRNQSNGGEVMRRTRYYPSIQGFGRPDYQYQPDLLLTIWDGNYIQLTDPLSFSSRVFELQKKLNTVGFALKCDGFYGQKTEAAVKEVQSRLGIEADGVVGPITWGKLFLADV